MCPAYSSLSYIHLVMSMGWNEWVISDSQLWVQFSSVPQLCPTLCDPMDCSTSGFPVHHQLPDFTQTHVHWVGDAIQPSHPLLSPSPAFNLCQHQGLFQWVGSLYQVAKGLELQLQHQSFQWIFRTDFLTIVWFDLLIVQGPLESYPELLGAKLSQWAQMGCPLWSNRHSQCGHIVW